MTGAAAAAPREAWTARWDRAAGRLLTERPRDCVLVALATAVVLGIAAPALGHSAFLRDMVEGFLWGRSLELGYSKHPPMQAWLLGLTERLTPDGWRWLAFLWSQACVVGSIVPVWLLSRALAGPAIGALSAMLTLAGIHFYTSPTQTLTPDTLSLPLWAMALLFYWRAVGEGRERYWYALALTAVGFVYAKYVGMLLFAILAVLTLATREGRAALRRPAPWLAALMALGLCLPHLWWLADTSGATLHYVVDRFTLVETGDRLAYPVRFFVNQALNHAALAVILVIAAVRIPFRPTAELVLERPALTPFATRFLIAVAVAPLAAVMAISIASGLYFRSGWGSPLYALSALGALLLLGRPLRLKNFSTVLAAVIFAIAVQHLTAGFGLHWSRQRDPATYPARPVAVELTEVFRARTGGPLRVVVGERWHAGNVAFYSPDRPLLLFDGDPAISPGRPADRIAGSGALLVWDAQSGTRMPAGIGGAFAGTAADGTIERPWANAYGAPLLRLNYAVVPPASAPADPTASKN